MRTTASWRLARSHNWLAGMPLENGVWVKPKMGDPGRPDHDWPSSVDPVFSVTAAVGSSRKAILPRVLLIGGLHESEVIDTSGRRGARWRREWDLALDV